MKLLGNLTIWHTVLDWCLAGSFSQMLLGHYYVQIGDLNTNLFQLDRCQIQMCSLFHRLEQWYILGSLLFVFHQWVWCTQAVSKEFDCERLDTTYFRLRELLPKAKIFRNSTSNWVRALSYSAGKALTNATPKIPKSVMVQHKIGVPVINVKNRTKYDF